MIDRHRGNCILNEGLDPVMNQVDHTFEAFGLTFFPKKVGLVYDSEGLFLNTFKLRLVYPDELIVINSLHKFLHNGFNVYDVTYQEMVQGLHKLYSSLPVNLSTVKISQIEFGCAIQVEQPLDLSQSLLYFENKPMLQYNENGNIIGKWHNAQQYKLKFYSKYHEMAQCLSTLNRFKQSGGDIDYLRKNLRTEFVIKRSRLLNRATPLSLYDFENKTLIKQIYLDFHKRCKKLTFQNGTLPSCCNESELFASALFENPNISYQRRLKTMSSIKYDYYKRLYQSFPRAKYEKQRFLEAIEDKINTLFK
ncbi:MAG TPA: hypothetical protein PK977_01405 [Chitinophagaceae bacterium]|nr:hypothetical protein [Chitinophagaceae bacterium]